MLKPKDLLIGLVAIILGLGCVSVVEAAANTTVANYGIISIPSTASCSCSLTMSCSCCQSVIINVVNDNKTLCVTFKISVLSGSVDIGVTMDGNSVAAFTVSTKTPPTACLPVVNNFGLDVCLKLTVSLAGLSGVKACPTFYTSYDSNQVISYAFPCVQLGLTGVSLV
ncbi:hypothetical protein KR018_004077 [Drosophila ironensis]|nr:hypothetical protein KR018_004077 [Drosophila ironensis]